MTRPAVAHLPERAAAPDWLGLCSITLRTLSPAEVLDETVAAGLRCIEWGADVHAPPDGGSLPALADLSAGHGIRVCSYGSYWRAGDGSRQQISAVVDAAVALRTSRVRIWAGSVGTALATDDDWARVVRATQEAARIAEGSGVSLAFELHGGTLTDTIDGTLRLLEAVGRDNVSTYWQPPLDIATDEAVAGLQRLLDRVSAVHTFSWWPGANRLPLSQRADLWRSVFQLLAQRATQPDVLMEFLPEDDPQRLAPEAASLRALLPG